MTIDGTKYKTGAATGSISNTAPLYLCAEAGGDYYSGRTDEVSIDTVDFERPVARRFWCPHGSLSSGGVFVR